MSQDMSATDPVSFVEEFIAVNGLEDVPADLDDYKARLLEAVIHEEMTASEPDWYEAACEVVYDLDDGLPDLRLVTE